MPSLLLLLTRFVHVSQICIRLGPSMHRTRPAHFFSNTRDSTYAPATTNAHHAYLLPFLRKISTYFHAQPTTRRARLTAVLLSYHHLPCSLSTLIVTIFYCTLMQLFHSPCIPLSFSLSDSGTTRPHLFTDWILCTFLPCYKPALPPVFYTTWPSKLPPSCTSQ